MKAKWREALLSGEFKQTRGELRNDYSEYCCLGVACEVFRRETGKGEWVLNIKDTWQFVVDMNVSGNTLPDPVAKWLGYELRDPELRLGKYATELNDIDGLSFSEIAEFI